MPLRGLLRKKISERKSGERLKPIERAANPGLQEHEEALRQEEEELRLRREELKRRKQELRSIKHREKIGEVIKVQPVEIVVQKTKFEWLLDILTGVFIIGVLLNSGITIGNFFTQNPSFEAMQTFLLFALLLQLIKIGKEI